MKRRQTRRNWVIGEFNTFYNYNDHDFFKLVITHADGEFSRFAKFFFFIKVDPKAAGMASTRFPCGKESYVHPGEDS